MFVHIIILLSSFISFCFLLSWRYKNRYDSRLIVQSASIFVSFIIFTLFFTSIGQIATKIEYGGTTSPLFEFYIRKLSSEEEVLVPAISIFTFIFLMFEILLGKFSPKAKKN